MAGSVLRIAPRTQTPKGLRLHIGLFGKRNAGKSSLLNALTEQSIAIVSDVAGTTTDPVEKAAEFSPLGPVVFVDTAGIDDVGALGTLRVNRSFSVLAWMDIALIVTTAATFGSLEEQLLEFTRKRQIPTIVVFNQADRALPSAEQHEALRRRAIACVAVSAKMHIGLDILREAIVQLAQENTEAEKPLLDGLIKAGDTIVLVTPIDTGAPKGRLILPQVQTVREVLDADAECVLVRENRLAETLRNLRQDPAFVVTDSQVVRSVCATVPVRIPVTTFSIEMAHTKSNLVELARGAASLNTLRPGNRVMICETCSHHPQPDDIGRKKLPRWLEEKVGGALRVDVVVGKDFPSDLSPYHAILQCGGCVVTRRHMLSRLAAAKEQGVPMTNYGLAISLLQGVLERALQLHPEALAAYHEVLERAHGIRHG